MDISDVLVWQIVKWVLIVLVAAFIGQFGKTFAQYLLSRFRRKQADESAAVTPAARTQSLEAEEPRIDRAAGEATLKAKKKESKVQLKAQKKAAKNS